MAWPLGEPLGRLGPRSNYQTTPERLISAPSPAHHPCMTQHRTSWRPLEAQGADTSDDIRPVTARRPAKEKKKNSNAPLSKETRHLHRSQNTDQAAAHLFAKTVLAAGQRPTSCPPAPTQARRRAQILTSRRRRTRQMQTQRSLGLITSYPGSPTRLVAISNQAMPPGPSRAHLSRSSSQ